MSGNTTHTTPAYLPYSMGLLWLWSGTQPLFFMPEMSLDLLHSVGIPNPLQWPTLIAASLLDIGFAFLCFSRLRSHSSVWLLQLITVAAYSLIIAFGCRNVGTSICAFGKKPADYGYFIFLVSIRRR